MRVPGYVNPQIPPPGVATHSDVLAKTGFLEGARLQRDTNAKAKIFAGFVADSTRTAIIEWTSTLNVDIETSGVGGLDTGSESADTWYAVHVIGDTTGVNAPAGIFSESPGFPTLPSGYDVFRRVGWVRNPSNSNFLRMRQTGNGRDRWVDWDANDEQFVISGGSASSFTNVDASAYAPSTSRRCMIIFYLDTGATGGADNFLNLREGGATRDFHDFHSPGVATNGEFFTTQANLFLDTLQTFDYAISPVDGSVFIGIRGYEDNL